MGGPPPRPTVESDVDEDDATPRPNIGSRRKSMSSSSSTTARRDNKTEPRRTSDKNSDSGYSTGTKGSADTGASGKPMVEKVEQAQIPPPSPKKSSRPAMDQRTPSSRSEASQRSSTKSAKTPSRAPSTKVSSRSERRREEVMPGSFEDVKAERRQSRSSETPRPSSKQQSSVRTSPTSSRSSRAPSSSSQEMPPPQSTVPLRARSSSRSRAGRPASFHGSYGDIQSYYAPTYAAGYDYDRGPPPSRSAYMNPSRPGLSVITPAQSYAPSVHPNGALQPSMYNQDRMAMRTQTEYSTSSTSSAQTQYSARRPITVFQDQPTSYDPATVSPPSPPPGPSPRRERKPERKAVSARKPADPPPYHEHQLDEQYSESDSGSEDDEYEEQPPQYLPIRRPSTRDNGGSYSARVNGRITPGGYGAYGTSPYGTSPYGTSPYGTSPARDFPAYFDEHYARAAEYRSAAPPNTDSSSSRRQSIASSGGGTKATSYSNSSGSGGHPADRRRSIYGQQFATTPADPATEAERYMNSVDRQAGHVRYQQPHLTQETLRQAEARAIEGKRSSKGGSNVSSHAASSRRSRTITAGEEQTVKLMINTSAGLDVAVEGDTEGRPIRLVQRPGESVAQLVIGTGNTRREETVYNGGSNSRSSGRTNGGSRVSTKTGSSKAAVSGRRERARTMAE